MDVGLFLTTTSVIKVPLGIAVGILGILRKIYAKIENLRVPRNGDSRLKARPYIVVGNASSDKEASKCGGVRPLIVTRQDVRIVAPCVNREDALLLVTVELFRNCLPPCSICFAHCHTVDANDV